jgi:transcriptional regulator with XRE-family HTH domain
MADRGDFATLLRAWRDRLRPEAVGIASKARRAAGLRREELASLAGISVDYVVRLEQGRADRPSEQVVGAIARALQLSEEERNQLFVAAGHAPRLPTDVPTLIPGSVQRLLARMPDVAIGVYAADWTLLSANDAWVALHGDMGTSARERNLVWRWFAGLPTRALHDPEQADRFQRAIIADLRTATIRYPGDHSLQTLIDELCAQSEAFAEMWRSTEVFVHRSEHKTIVHPTVGPIVADCDVFTVSGTDLKIVTFTAEPGSEDESKLALARTLGAIEHENAHKHESTHEHESTSTTPN